VSLGGWGEDDGAPAALRCEGEYWTFSFARRTVRVRDSKGIAYLAQLLARPGVEVDVLSLSGRDGAGADLGPVLDEQAKRAYRRRLAELQDEVDEAEAFSDSERAARAKAELDALVQQLAAATGLGGRDRRMGSATERARLNVTRAIKSAVARVAEADTALGAHLAAAVRTGRVCVYRPDDERGAWTVATQPASAPTAGTADLPETGYARSGDVSIAYQVVGEGSVDLVVIPGFLSHLDLQWSGGAYGRFLNGLAGFSRLLLFDKRGVGLSDPVGAAPTLEERMDDVRAVMDAAGSRRAVVFGMSEGTPLACLFAATFP